MLEVRIDSSQLRQLYGLEQVKIAHLVDCDTWKKLKVTLALKTSALACFSMTCWKDHLSSTEVLFIFVKTRADLYGSISGFSFLFHISIPISSAEHRRLGQNAYSDLLAWVILGK